jgi:hypothetical protein
MASSSKRKQTQAKFARDRALKEKREMKAAKKEEKKRLKAEGLEFPAGEPLPLSTDESLESPSAAGSE